MPRASHPSRLAACSSYGILSALAIASSATAQIWVPNPEVPDLKTAYEKAWEGVTISLSAGTHTIDSTLDAEGTNIHLVGEVDAAGNPITTIDGEGLRRILLIRTGESSATVYENIRFANGFAVGENGGAIQIADADPRFVNCVFEGNRAAFKGGAMHIYGSNADVMITGSRFVANVVGSGNAGSGGALAIEQRSEVEIHDSFFAQNRAASGGALWSGGSAYRIENSLLQANAASGNGGAIYLNGGELEVGETRFEGNLAVALRGGAIMLYSAAAQIEKCGFDGNSSGLSGGALLTLGSGSTCLVGQSEFVRNIAGEDGGAVSLRYGQATFWETVFQGNSAAAEGGAIEVVNADVRLERIEGFGNSATVGGFLRQDGGHLEVWGSQVTGNAASAAGGLRLMSGGTADLLESTVCENDAEPILGAWNDLGDNCVAEICGCGCPADLNGDGQVNGADFGLLITAWGTGAGPADLDGDGQVSATDLGLLFAAWGPCS